MIRITRAIWLDEFDKIERLVKVYDGGCLSLYKSFVDDNIINIILNSLKNNIDVNELDLSNNEITDVGAVYIANFLTNNTTITTINLSNNQISNNGVKAIFKSLSINNTLNKLFLPNNHITDAGIIGIDESLKNNSSLYTLSLTYNRITDKGAAAIFNLLKISTILTVLYLFDNLITLDMFKLICKQLAINECNNITRNMSLQQLCYKIIKNNNIHCPESYKTIYELKN